MKAIANIGTISRAQMNVILVCYKGCYLTLFFFLFNFYRGKLFDILNIINYCDIKILHIFDFLPSLVNLHFCNTTAIPSTTNFWRMHSFFVLNFVQDEFLPQLDQNKYDLCAKKSRNYVRFKDAILFLCAKSQCIDGCLLFFLIFPRNFFSCLFFPFFLF